MSNAAGKASWEGNILLVKLHINGIYVNNIDSF